MGELAESVAFAVKMVIVAIRALVLVIAQK